MKINDKYIIDLIVSAIYKNKKDFPTPKDYLIDYDYDQTHSITIKDLRNVLNDVFEKGE